jgi:cytosine/adenosine deaminase-related metal-dependent hydrolase
LLVSSATLYCRTHSTKIPQVKTLLRAAHLLTMSSPPIRDGAVVFHDRQILAAGPAAAIRQNHPDANIIDLGDSIILPGLVNAHTHLELSNIQQLPDPASLVDWILALLQRRSTSDPDAAIHAAVAKGIRESIRHGVTAVGDITLNPAISRPLLRDSPLRGVSFGEVLGMAGRAAQMEGRLAAAVDRSHEREDFRTGIEPHAPYSLDLRGYARCLEEARRHDMPLTTHLAESPDEAPFLNDHSGPFRHKLWETIAAWTNDVSRAPGGPIRAMASLGLFDYPTLLAHANYADDDELDILARGKASIVYCPRTHAYFGHPPHRFVDMLSRGINVAVGTDSTASSPDLNLMDDLRLIHRQRPDVDPMTIFEMATVQGAKALRMENRIGRIAPGFAPDFCIFDVKSNRPLHELLESEILPREVWIAGIRQAAAP